MLCDGHHDAYDEHELEITALTARQCDGPLRYEMGDATYEEPDDAAA